MAALHAPRPSTCCWAPLLLSQPLRWRCFPAGWLAPLLTCTPHRDRRVPLSPSPALRLPMGRPSRSEMLVQWTSRDSSAPRVRWAVRRGGPYPHAALAETTTYTREDVCGGAAQGVGWAAGPGSLHAALLTGLQAGQRYYYQYGSEVQRHVWLWGAGVELRVEDWRQWPWCGGALPLPSRVSYALNGRKAGGRRHSTPRGVLHAT
jgi:hypothetical protein